MQFDIVDDYSTDFTPPVIALAGGDNFTNIVLGSGVIIAPYLALTAKHVMDQGFLKHFFGDRLLNADGSIRVPKDLDLVLQAACGDKENAAAFRFAVEHFSFSTVSDLALLRIMPLFSQEGYLWPCVKINALPPVAGEKIAAYGYVYGDGEVEHGTIRSLPKLHRSQGTVEEVFLMQRDRSLVYFPSFQTNARCDHSMSGGPVFSGNGKLAGIVSVGGPPDNGKHYSIAASIWPIVGSRLDAWLPGQSQPKTCSLKHLIDIGLIHIEGLEAFNIEYDDEGFVKSMYTK